MFQKISKAFELSNLLVSLFAVVDGKNDADSDKSCPYLLQSRRKPIDDVVQEKLDTMRKKSEKLRKNSNSRKRYKINFNLLFIVADRQKRGMQFVF